MPPPLPPLSPSHCRCSPTLNCCTLSHSNIMTLSWGKHMLGVWNLINDKIISFIWDFPHLIISFIAYKLPDQVGNPISLLLTKTQPPHSLNPYLSSPLVSFSMECCCRRSVSDCICSERGGSPICNYVHSLLVETESFVNVRVWRWVNDSESC